MKKHICFLAAAFIILTEVVSGQDFIFRFENYNKGDTAFLQIGPEYRSPRYPVIVSDGNVNYRNDSIADILLARIYIKGNYGTPFVMERGKIHTVKNGYVQGSTDNDCFHQILDSIWGGEVFDKIMEASRLRDSAKTESEKKRYYDLLIERHNERDRNVKKFLETDTLGVGLYIAYILRLTAKPNEMKLWLDNHKRFAGDEHYKRIMNIYIPQSKTDLGMILPNFQAVDTTGKSFDLYQFLDKFKGKAIVLDFWASWCHACRAKSPKLMELYNKYKGSGLTVIGISSDKTEEPWIKAIRKDKTGSWIHLIDKNNTTGKMYGIPGIPKTFVLDKKGMIHYYGVGGLADEEEAVEKLLKSSR